MNTIILERKKEGEGLTHGQNVSVRCFKIRIWNAQIPVLVIGTDTHKKTYRYHDTDASRCRGIRLANHDSSA